MINKQQALILVTLAISGLGLGAVSAAIHGFATPPAVKLTKSEPPKIAESKPAPLVTTSPTTTPTEATTTEPENNSSEEEETAPVKPIKTKIIQQDREPTPREQTPIVKKRVIIEKTEKRVAKKEDNDEEVVKPKRRVRIVEPKVIRQEEPEPKIIKKDYDRRKDIIIKNTDDEEAPRVRKSPRNVVKVEDQPKVEPRTEPRTKRRQRTEVTEDTKKTIEETPVKRRQRDMDDEPKPERDHAQLDNNKPKIEKPEVTARETEPKVTPKEPVINTSQEKETEE